MLKTVRAVYDKGVLRLLERVELPAGREVTIAILDDEVSAEGIPALAEAGHSFDFLAEVAENAYSLEDGEPV